MKTDINDIDYLESQYLNDRLTDEEKRTLDEKYDYGKAFNRFRQRSGLASEMPSAVHGSRFLHWVAGIAAAIVVLFVTTWFSYHSGQDALKGVFTDIVITAPKGSSTQVTMPDGSTVLLNSGSRLSYSQGFGVSDREVRITGEGYFEVVKDSSKPFKVISDNVKVIVLGTKFDFRDYPEDTSAEVTLDEGSVNMSHLASNQNVTLRPQQQAIMDKKTGEMIVKTFGVNDNMSKWKNGILSFNGESLGEICKILERSYDVKITFANPEKAELHFYGAFFRSSQSIHEIMTNLASTKRIRFTQKETEIVIY